MFIVCFQFSFEYFWVHQPKLRVIFTCAAVECCLPYHVHAGFLKTWFDRLWKDRQVVHRMTTSDHEWQQVVQRVTANDNQWYNEWKRMTTSGKTSDNEWQRVTTSVQQMAPSDNEWRRVTTSGTTSDKEWKWVTKSDNEWQWVTASESSGTANENGTEHFKEWIIAIISMTKRDTLLLQGMDGCN